MNTQILTIFILLFTQQLVCAQYYVSPTGSDNNQGTHQQPFRSIQKAADIMLAGDTCYIMKGIYRETVIPVNSGMSDNNPIVFASYNNERVVILGSDPVSGWSLYKDGIYKSYVPKNVSQLFVEGKRAYPARYPDYSGKDILSTSDWSPVTAKENGTAVFPNMNKPENYWIGAYCKVLTGRKWIAHVGKISGSNNDSVHCDKRSSPWNEEEPKIYLGEGMGYIYKHLNALDKTNEWHWQNDTLYYFPEDGAEIETLKVEARTRLYGFDCSNKSYIKINNIHFVWSSVNFSGATGCMFNKGSVWFPTPDFYYENSWTRNEKKGSSIDHWDGKGVTVSGRDNTIKNCYVAYSWGDGISVGGANNRIENCVVEHCNWSATDCAIISVTGEGHNIISNTIHTSARSALIHRHCRSSKFKYNHIYNCGLMCDDLGLTYSFRTNGAGSEISYNKLHDNHAHGTASGIYLDNYDSNYIVHHNVIWNCRHAIHTNRPGVNLEIYNNTIWSCEKSQRSWGHEGTELENVKVINNLSDKPWEKGTFFQTNIVSNPMFVDTLNMEFRLMKNSPAIDYGTHIPGITDNYIGAAPDAGAYEFGGKQWEAGSDIKIPDMSDIVVISEL